MNFKSLFIIVMLLTTLTAISQQKFNYSPDKPKPGDQVEIVYTPGPGGGGKEPLVEAAVYQYSQKGFAAEDLVLVKEGNSWKGKVKTDENTSMVFFGFKAGEEFDNNNNEGYYFLLYEGDKPRPFAYFTLGQFYQFMGGRVGVESNPEKALEMMEKELELHPESRKEILLPYVNLKARVKREEAAKVYQEAIEEQIKLGLKTENDYRGLSSLYTMAKLPEQSSLILGIIREKFPDGLWKADELVQRYQTEKDLEKKQAILNEMEEKVKSGDATYKGIAEEIDYYRRQITSRYITLRDWEKFKLAMEETKMEDPSLIASLYNSAAWEMQKDSSRLDLAELFVSKAYGIAESIANDPNGKKPDYMTGKQWAQNKQATKAQFADTYAMVLYRAGKYKKGYDLAKTAAITISKGKDPEQNNTYALLASKVLSRKKLVTELEEFVRDGKHSAAMRDMLKDAYVKKKKSENGFEDYMAELQKEAYEKLLAELSKSMLDEAAPSFALYNLDGKKTDISELRGKVVVVDFWATWCGPCIASFPAMQKAMDKYKNDPNVKFIFIDTWESGDDKKANAQNFITKNKYRFDVWMDETDEVVTQFKVEGIPTKFVLDPEGKIRFKSVGFDGSDEKLVMELSAMIDMAGKKG